MKRNLVRKLTAILLLLHAANSIFADNYELYSGTITEGDYVIVHTYAMKSAIVNSRFDIASVTITDGIITNEFFSNNKRLCYPIWTWLNTIA